ncbi:hypothetical protein C8R44DRAFT_990873 [Mycena epipterygia]|nr:hypothetical protein C8R44DRAFT_990873 [Mycena epipterygia]
MPGSFRVIRISITDSLVAMYLSIRISHHINSGGMVIWGISQLPKHQKECVFRSSLPDFTHNMLSPHSDADTHASLRSEDVRFFLDRIGLTPAPLDPLAIVPVPRMATQSQWIYTTEHNRGDDRTTVVIQSVPSHIARRPQDLMQSAFRCPPTPRIPCCPLPGYPVHYTAQTPDIFPILLSQPGVPDTEQSAFGPHSGLHHPLHPRRL